METLIVIIAIGIVLYFVFRKKKKPTQTVNSSKQTEKQISPPRDYLDEATSFVGAPRPLKELLKTNRAEVIHNLVNTLNLDANIQQGGIPMGPTIRKEAAYALGQIGDPSTVAALTSRLNIERASGVRDAIVASISAINLAPDPEYTELDRRKIIDDVYNKRRPAQLSSWKST